MALLESVLSSGLEVLAECEAQEKKGAGKAAKAAPSRNNPDVSIEFFFGFFSLSPHFRSGIFSSEN